MIVVVVVVVVVVGGDDGHDDAWLKLKQVEVELPIVVWWFLEECLTLVASIPELYWKKSI